ncbi:hypothetical protein MINTM001_50310 [Mycobacterium paraintracellulare]|uniref:DUF7159 family protein n=1 Tax=Mycobacterium paraintracellulare TaxID=1138383 RepID=UPI0019354F6D|nr:hypothetical protein MINTM001_50310 [Mycobacterium paraintracellulare]
MEVVLGVSMAPETVRMVLVEGAAAGGVTVDQDGFDVVGDPTPAAAADHVVAAILGTRDSAALGGYQLKSSGVSWTDPAEAAALRDVLAARRIENVMLVSAVMAAAALAQAMGSATNWARTALLLVEPTSATLAVVDTSNGTVTDVHRHPLPGRDDVALAKLTAMVSGAESMRARPDGLFLVGSDVDIPLIKPTLEAATSLSVTTPEEPEMALARVPRWPRRTHGWARRGRSRCRPRGFPRPRRPGPPTTPTRGPPGHASGTAESRRPPSRS